MKLFSQSGSERERGPLTGSRELHAAELLLVFSWPTCADVGVKIVTVLQTEAQLNMLTVFSYENLKNIQFKRNRLL